MVRLDEILNKSCHERNRKHLHIFLNILRIVPIYLGQLNYKDSLSPVIVCPQWQFFPKPVCPQTSLSPDQFVPKTVCPQDSLSPRQFVPETVCPRDSLSPVTIRPQKFVPGDKLFWGRIVTGDELFQGQTVTGDKLSQGQTVLGTNCPGDKFFGDKLSRDKLSRDKLLCIHSKHSSIRTFRKWFAEKV